MCLCSIRLQQIPSLKSPEHLLHSGCWKQPSPRKRRGTIKRIRCSQHCSFPDSGPSYKSSLWWWQFGVASQRYSFTFFSDFRKRNFCSVRYGNNRHKNTSYEYPYIQYMNVGMRFHQSSHKFMGYGNISASCKAWWDIWKALEAKGSGSARLLLKRSMPQTANYIIISGNAIVLTLARGIPL